MRAQFGRYLNDVVSLSVMLMMAIALIAGQVATSAPVVEQVSRHMTESPASFLDASVRIESGSMGTALHFDMVLNDFIITLATPVTSDATTEISGSKLKLGK